MQILKNVHILGVLWFILVSYQVLCSLSCTVIRVLFNYEMAFDARMCITAGLNSTAAEVCSVNNLCFQAKSHWLGSGGVLPAFSSQSSATGVFSQVQPRCRALAAFYMCVHAYVWDMMSPWAAVELMRQQTCVLPMSSWRWRKQPWFFFSLSLSPPASWSLAHRPSHPTCELCLCLTHIFLSLSTC